MNQAIADTENVSTVIHCLLHHYLQWKSTAGAKGKMGGDHAGLQVLLDYKHIFSKVQVSPVFNLKHMNRLVPNTHSPSAVTEGIQHNRPRTWPMRGSLFMVSVVEPLGREQRQPQMWPSGFLSYEQAGGKSIKKNILSLQIVLFILYFCLYRKFALFFNLFSFMSRQ